MDSLNLNKSDLKYLLLLVALAPVISFIAGAGFSALFRSNSVTAQPFPVANIVKEEAQTPGTNVVAPVSEPQSRAAPALSVTLDKGVVERVAYGKQYVVQAGVFSNRDNARNRVTELRDISLMAQVLREADQTDTLYRVILAAFASPERAQAYAEKIKVSHKIALYVTSTDSTAPLHNLAAL